jgi:hypothetical protein
LKPVHHVDRNKTHNLSTRCVRNRLVASLSTSCNNVVISSSCYKLVTHNLLTNCWIAGRWQVVGTTCNKSVEFNNLVDNLSTSRRQLVNKLGTSSANTSCWQVVGTALALLHVCCRFVTTCAREANDLSYKNFVLETRL